MAKTVHIIRGISGSGKSTYARIIVDKNADCDICSADDFFMEDGEYKFNPSLIAQAHARCMERFIKMLDGEVDQIIVDNTNTRYWEFKNYIHVAHLAGYAVHVHQMSTPEYKDALKCIERNVHGVPTEIALEMWSRFEYWDDDDALRHGCKLTQVLPEFD